MHGNSNELGQLAQLVLAMALLSAIIFFGAIFGSLALAVIALYAAKVRRPLVAERNVFSAAWASMGAAAAICIGLYLGSVLLLAFTAPPDGMRSIGKGVAFVQKWVEIDHWMSSDPLVFFIKMSVVLFLVNRISIIREISGVRSLSILAPVMAASVFAVPEQVIFWHQDGWLSLPHLTSLLSGTFDNLIKPVRLWAEHNNDFPAFVSAYLGSFADEYRNLFRFSEIFPHVYLVASVAYLSDLFSSR